jgi:hypothetical protein
MLPPVTGGSSSSIDIYSATAAGLAADYEALDPAAFRQSFADLLPTGPDRLALDIGAGSGRDAAWLVDLGFGVVAAEPAKGFREVARRLRPTSPVRWLDDRLPALAATHQLGLAFDVVLLSAVWQHVAPDDRKRAFRKTAALLKPRGLLIIILRFGPAPAGRPMFEVSVGEIEALAREHGLAVNRVTAPMPDGAGRPGVSWVTMCLTLPDDGAGALPLLRGIILNDAKTTTYKLGLLRCIARLGDLAPALAVAGPGDDEVVLPLGAVALNWLRLYLPLVSAGLPQSPTNVGPDGLGFVRNAFRGLMASGIAPSELRIGASFSGDRAVLLMQALGDAAATIAKMPASFTTYPGSEARVFKATAQRARASNSLLLDRDTLALFGSIVVPGHIWRAMQRMGAWIEPVLVAEWARLTRSYAEPKGLAIPPGIVETALTWVEPVRDVQVARKLALARMDSGEPLHCVWSGQRLRTSSLDIDHCLPWSAWPCGDLWNLLPAHSSINRHLKRDKLPSASALVSAKPHIEAWWQDAWERHPTFGDRFRREATAALAVPANAAISEIFEALEWRRLRLRQDAQIAEWEGAS